MVASLPPESDTPYCWRLPMRNGLSSRSGFNVTTPPFCLQRFSAAFWSVHPKRADPVLVVSRPKKLSGHVVWS